MVTRKVAEESKWQRFGMASLGASRKATHQPAFVTQPAVSMRILSLCTYSRAGGNAGKRCARNECRKGLRHNFSIFFCTTVRITFPGHSCHRGSLQHRSSLLSLRLAPTQHHQHHLPRPLPTPQIHDLMWPLHTQAYFSLPAFIKKMDAH